MSIRRHIIANYVGQLYATLIGILLVPLYVRYMGVEAYGLVGFYTMLQGWFMLLDMGLTPTLGREAARFNGGAIGALELRRLLRALEGIFAVVAIAGAAALVAAADLVAARWLRAQAIDLAEVRQALELMAVIVAMRGVGGLYRGAIVGFERIVWLSGFNVLVATLRFVLVVPYLAFVGATPTHFFAYQLGVTALETAVLIGQTYRLLPPVPSGPRVRWAWQPLRTVRRFALGAAFTSAIWVVVTQTDKLVLSGLIPLTDYGYFTLAVLVASGIVLLASPISGAIQPRLTRLHAEGDEAALVRLYRAATQLAAVIAAPIVLVLAVFPLQVLTAWTGKADLAQHAAPMLRLYAVGNGLLALGAFPYYLQVARGELSLHVIGNLAFLVVFVPMLLLAVTRWGVVGAGYAWIAANLLPFATWLPLVHRRHLRGLHLGWMGRDIVAIVVPPALGALLAWRVVEWPQGRGPLVAALLLLYAMLALLAALGSSSLRGRVRTHLQARFG